MNAASWHRRGSAVPVPDERLRNRFGVSVTIQEIRDAVWELNEEKALALVAQGLAEGLDPLAMLRQGIIAGLGVIGDKFGAGEYFLTELVMGGRLAEPCIELIRRHLPLTVEGRHGTVVIGAVKGDLHTLGYGLVAMQLELVGFEVHKLGVDLSPLHIIKKAQEHDADIIGLSAFLPTTIPSCPEVIDYLRDMGLRDRYRVIIGGAVCNAATADSMDADGWALNAVAAVPLCTRLMGRDVGDEATRATGYDHPWWYNARRH
jgi:5-methyltetrahydrofolate--homocysteine methyltransferase